MKNVVKKNKKTNGISFLPEVLRFLGMPSNIAANMCQIIYGLALVVIMFKFSQGFLTNETKIR